jgi:hypothetical protein
MKPIVLIFTILFVLIAPLDSTAKDDDSVKYEVTIRVVYNAVSPVYAAKIAKLAMLEHSEACKVDVDVKKVTERDSYTIIDGAVNLTQEEYDSLMGQ